MTRIPAFLAAGLIGAPIAAFAQSPPPVVVVYPAPAVQPGNAYYCSRPAGWYPAVRNCATEWVTYVQQPAVYARPVAPSTPAYPVPAPQAGVAYYCGAPEGWYPAVQACSTSWVAYAQQPVVTYVVPAPASTPVILVERPETRGGPDAASVSTRSSVNP
jgi:hypothetical protein